MEILDIYDDNGNLTGNTIIRGDKSVTLNSHEHKALVCGRRTGENNRKKISA